MLSQDCLQNGTQNPTEQVYQNLDYYFVGNEQDEGGPSHDSSFDNDPMINESSSLVQVKLLVYMVYYKAA